MPQFEQIAGLAGYEMHSYYAPLVLQPTGQYKTAAAADRGAVVAYDVSVSPSTFPVVLLVTDADVYPSRFQFLMRSALAQLGQTHVVNSEEFRQLAADKKVEVSYGTVNAQEVKRYSESVAPVLVVGASYRFVGEARTKAALRVMDGRTGKVLFEIDHQKTIWTSFDEEGVYPMLNEMRKWYLESARRSI